MFNASPSNTLSWLEPSITLACSKSEKLLRGLKYASVHRGQEKKKLGRAWLVMRGDYDPILPLPIQVTP